MSIYEDPTTWRLQTGGSGVPYRILGMSGTFEPESATANMEVLIPANKLIQFATEMFPAYYYSGSGFPLYRSFGRIYGTPLFSHKISWKAHVDGKPVDPFGVDPGAPAGTYQDVVQCSIDYATMNDQTESDENQPETFLEVSCTGGGQFKNVSSQGATWEQSEGVPCTDARGSNVEIDAPAYRIEPSVDWDLHWPRVPYVYWTNTLLAKIRAALGCVNSAAMPIFANAPRGTVIFMGFSLRKSYTWRAGATYQQPFNLNLKFNEKRVVDSGGTVRGHNDMWRPGYGWRYLKHRDGSPIYSYYNLTSIFTP